DELVVLGRLDDAVEEEGAAEDRILDDEQFLESGLALEKHAVGTKPLRDRRAVQLLLDPARLVHVAAPPPPRRCSLTAMKRGANARRSTGTAFCGSHLPHMKTSSAA